MTARQASARDWLDDLSAAGIARLALAMGLQPGPNGQGWRCPVCGAEARGSGDPRGPVGLVAGGLGWVCFRCSAKGDAVALAAAIVTGSTRPERGRWRDVRAAAACAGLCEPEANTTPTAAPRGRSHAHRVRAPAAAPTYPPSAEVHALWAAGVSVLEHAEVRGWLQRRAIDPLSVADSGLARALSPRRAVPRWAWRSGAPWPEKYPLIVPMFDARGRLVTLHARAVGDVPPQEKATSPVGFELRGTVMADAVGLALLRGVALPTGESVPDLVRSSVGILPTADGSLRCGLVICEGVPDFLAATCTWSEGADVTPAVLGVIAGSWTKDVAARVPSGARVVIATHADQQGDRYAERIIETLGGRCDLFRWTPAPEVHP